MMLDSINCIDRYVSDYGVCAEDIVFLALNACGLSTFTPIPRMRLRIRLDSRPEEEFRFILSTCRPMSPFEVRGDRLFLLGEPIGTVREQQDDNAVIGYFRRNNTVITLNSNTRSHCTGCVFCPNTLEGSSDDRQVSKDQLLQSIRLLLTANGMADLSHVEEINLSTGCFGSEAPAIKHLAIVQAVATELGSHASLGLLSSVIRSDEAFAAIGNVVDDFHLVLTIECFSNRDVILKSTKADLTVPMMPDLLKRAKDHGHQTDYTYIVGLDDTELMLEVTRDLAPNLTRFPNLQVYQAHNGLMDRFCAPGADTMEFFLNARRGLEEIFEPTGLRPLSWENYRPLWYYEFAGEPLKGIRS